MEDSMGVVANFHSSDDETVQPNGSSKETDNVGDDLLYDLDSYLEDLNDRLVISRMVNDSIIKGMVNAFTEEAAEKIAQKDLEVASLKERLQLCESGACKVEKLNFPIQDSVEECVSNFRMESEKQFHMLEKTIENIKGCRLLAGQSETKESEKWAEVEQTLHTLKNMLNTVCTEVPNMVSSSRISPCEWKEEREFQGEVEPMALSNSSRSLPVGFDVLSWEQRAESCSSQTANYLAKLNQLSSLREELSSISRTLSSPEIGHLSLNGSQEDSEELSNGTIKDHFHHEVISNLTSQDNGKKEPKSAMPETLEAAQLKHMSKEEAIAYYKSKITKMNREHESLLHEKTEAYFRLRRDYFKLKGPLSSLRRDKEFEAFRRRISEALAKLDNMLVNTDKLPVVYENNDLICSLKNRTDTLLSENLQIKELLINKSKEVKCLSSQVSNAADRMSNHSSAEANLLKQIRKLKGDIEDMKIEIAVRESVWGCKLKELIDRTKAAIQDSDMESRSTLEIYEIIFREFALDANAMIKCDIEDSDMESMFMQKISGIVFREALKDVEDRMSLMKMKYEKENKLRVCLEASILKSERALNMEIEEKGQLKKEILRLKSENALSLESVFMEEISGIVFREAVKDVEDTMSLMKMKYEEENKLRVGLEASVLKSEIALSVAIEEKGQLKKEILRLKSENDVSLESMFMEEISGIVFREAVKDAEDTMSLMKMRYEEENKLQVDLEASVLKGESALGVAIQEKEQLKKEILKLKSEKDVSLESMFMEEISGIVFREAVKDVEDTMSLMKMQYEEENKQRVCLEASVLKSESALSVEIEEKGQLKKEILRLKSENALALKSFVAAAQKLHEAAAAGFEGRVEEALESTSLRWKSLKFQLDSLLEKATSFRNMELVYKQRLERKTSDLQKAEAEVDLLGDEVDALLSLLEKIYVALCHYSPVLQHYPGIMEILKLIRKELSVDTTYDSRRSVETTKVN